MGRIDANLKRLQPVAFDEPLEGKHVAVRRNETIQIREGRRLALAHVGPQNAGPLHHRIGGVLKLLVHAAALRLGRLLKALSGGIKQPAMERAAQAAIFQAAVAQIGAAVRAVLADQAIAAILVLERHQVFAQQLHRPHRPRAFKFIHQGGRLPIVAHHAPCPGAGPGPGDQFIEFCA